VQTDAGEAARVPVLLVAVHAGRGAHGVVAAGARGAVVLIQDVAPAGGRGKLYRN